MKKVVPKVELLSRFFLKIWLELNPPPFPLQKGEGGCTLWSDTLKFRSGSPEVFCKKAVFKNFAKFSGKHLCESLFFNKVAGPRSATLLKKRLWYRCFPGVFPSLYIEYLRWLKIIILYYKSRSSHAEVFCKKGVLRNFTKFIGKHLCQSLFFKKKEIY